MDNHIILAVAGGVLVSCATYASNSYFQKNVDKVEYVKIFLLNTIMYYCLLKAYTYMSGNTLPKVSVSKIGGGGSNNLQSVQGGGYYNDAIYVGQPNF